MHLKQLLLISTHYFVLTKCIIANRTPNIIFILADDLGKYLNSIKTCQDKHNINLMGICSIILIMDAEC